MGAGLAMGEVQTGLLQHSGAVPADLAARILAPYGMRARRAERPIAFVASPDTVTGVDCELPSAAGGRIRGVGTVLSRASVTGGQVVQGSAFVQVRPAELGRRLPWSHYLSRPGVVEVLGRTSQDNVASGFLSADPGRAGVLNLGAIGQRAMDAVQASSLLDHFPAMKARRTRLRWAVDTTAPARSITFTIHTELFRTIHLRAGHADAAAVAALCEDLALHDWLLTTLMSYIDRARIGSAPRSAVVAWLQPTIDHLLHLWMPAARVDPTLADLWQSLDRHPGLTRQWQATVDRVRDQLALATVEVMNRPRDK
jgi:hypothetical protein